MAKKVKEETKKPTEAKKPETSETPKSDVVDLGLLKIGSSKVFVNRIPSKANAVVVNYKNSENYYRISCVIPPHSYIINVDDSDYDEDRDDDYRPCDDASKFQIDSPTLLFMAEYATLPKPTIGTNFGTTFSIFALNTAQTDHIAVKPYMLSNTYVDGKICMGYFEPISLLKAFNTFWGSVFNDELFHHIHEMTDDYKPADMFSHLLNFHTHLLPKLKWSNLTNTVCGKDHWAAARGADGVLVTDNQTLLKCIPKEFWREDFGGTPITITLANLKDDVWHFESGNFKFQLPLKNVTTKNAKRSNANVELNSAQRRAHYNQYL
jgi:hypothetical protein